MTSNLPFRPPTVRYFERVVYYGGFMEQNDADATKEAVSVIGRLRQTAAIPEREAKLLEGLISGKTGEVAVKEAGYNITGKNAQVFADAIRKKHSDKNGELTDCLTKVGVTMDRVAQKIAEGLDAGTFMKSGKDIVERPDFNTRHKYLETTLDIMGARAPTKSLVEQVHTHEETIAIVEGIRENPEILAAIKRRIEQRTVTETTTGPDVEEAEIVEE